MGFDKELYRHRRASGKRGQGDHYFTKRGFTYADPAKRMATVGNKPVSKKALRKHTKRARKMLREAMA